MSAGRLEPPRASAATQRRPLISLVLPVYNEEANVRRAYDALCALFAGLARYDIELIFTDNHSDDGTFRVLEEIAARDPRVKVLRFNRNYGFQRSLLTGYRQAAGDAAIQIDCDLQDPPDVIPELLARWEEGHDVVAGLRRNRPESTPLAFTRRQFYALLHRISEERITSDAGDFRLIDRTILDRLAQLRDVEPYVRGTIASFATNETTVPYDRVARQYGESKFPLAQLVAFGWSGILSHSLLPLRVATYVGLLLALVTFLVTAISAVSWLLSAGDRSGTVAPSTVLILLGMSLNALFLGVLGEYVGRIYRQMRDHPLTVIERTINVDAAPDMPQPGRVREA